MGKKNLNPADAYRKAQRKKELKKNKAERSKARDLVLVKKDTSDLELAIRELEASRDDSEKLGELKAELEKINKKKAEYVEEHPEARRLVYKRRKEGEPEPELPTKRKRNYFDKNGLPRHPERSIYYDPVMNPYGMPPPGMPYVQRPLLPGEVDSDPETEEDEDDIPYGLPPDAVLIESDDDIPMPDGPPPQKSADKDDDIKLPLLPPHIPPVSMSGIPPLPSGSPPVPGSLPFHTIPSLLPGTQGMVPPPPGPPPAGPPASYPMVPPPPGPPPGQQPAPYPVPPSLPPGPPPGQQAWPYPFPPPFPTGFNGQIPPPPPGFPTLPNAFPPSPPNAFPPPPPKFLPRQQNMSAMQDHYHLSPIKPFRHIKTPTGLPLNPSLPSKPTAAAELAAATVYSAPQLRDLKKEATAFVPNAVKRKKGTTVPASSKINAAPSLSVDDATEEQPEAGATRPDLVSALKNQFGPAPPKPTPVVKTGKSDYDKFVEEMGDILGPN